MKRLKKSIHNIKAILQLQLSISKTPLIYEIVLAILEKVKIFIEITFPAFLIDLLMSKQSWKHSVVYIFIFSITVVLMEFFYKKIKALLSAHASRMDNMIMLKINQKSMTVDYKDTILDESVKTKEKARQAISEFLEIDYILFTQLLGSILSLSALGYLIFKLDTIVLFVIFLVAIVQYFLSKKTIKKEHQYEIKKSELSRKRQYLEELLFDMRYGKEIRTYNASNYIKDKFLRISTEAIKIEQEKGRYGIQIKVLHNVLQFIQTIGVYLFAIYKYTLGVTTIGTFTIYLNATKEIAQSIKDLFDSIAEITKINVYFEDYEEYMVLPTNIYSIEKKKVIDDTRSLAIEFKNVSFKYPDSDIYVLNNISFKINQGETISIVGENGAGKTTLIHLLMRLYDVTEGFIYVNDVDIREYSYKEYIDLISPVFQDYQLFSYSIKENMVFDRPVDEKKLQECYYAADLWNKICTLPSGDETILTKDLSEEGMDMSGGEKQKLAIARAYYHNGEMMVLDEPTASIDALSEHRIYKNIYNYTKDKITIFISHRLTSTLFSDNILVLKDGRLVEMGKHAVLIENRGFYSEMFQKQAYYYQDEAI